jgi:hypothetical protein
MKLKIYDASWLVNYGGKSARHKNYAFSGYPLGGVRYLVAHVVDALATCGDAIVCFDRKTNRSAMLPGYKAGRPHEAYIASQCEYAYSALMRCGVSCTRHDGYEADDLIASVISRYAGDYSEVVIVSNDRDLAHNVFSHISLHATSADGIDIHPDNFMYTAQPGETVLYNTISAWKVFCGDHSDHIPVFKTSSGVSGRALYMQYASFVNNLAVDDGKRPYVASTKELLNYFIQTLDLSANDMSVLSSRVSVIFPRYFDGVEKPSSMGDVSPRDLERLLSVLDCPPQLKLWGLNKVKINGEDYESFKSAAQVLRDGTFAVDNDCPVHDPFTEGQAVNLRVF